MNTRDQTIKDEIIAGLVEARECILAAASAVPPAKQDEVFLGVWSMKELLAHLVGWDHANLQAAQEILGNRLPSFYAHRDRGWKSYNESLVARYRQEDYAELLASVEGSHRELIEYLRTVPAKEFDRDRGLRVGRYKVTIARLLRAETDDEKKHCAQIQEFLGGGGIIMKITSREFHGDEDYQRVRELLMESYAITQRLHNWELARWDSFRFGAHWREEIEGAWHWEADVHLWETDAGQLVGVVNPEERGDVFLQIHPHYRHLEGEMLDWAEAHHQALKPADADPWPLNLFVYQYDKERAALLARRGYRNRGPAGVNRSCSLDGDIPKVEVPEGYGIRYPRGEDERDLEQQAAVINRVFNANFTRDAIRVLRRVPTHCEDLVVVAPDGTFAAFCSIWFDEFNRTGAFEPVGTHPDHRRLGLAKAVLCEGLRRLKELGATVAFVGTGYDAPANRLYESVGFTEVDVVDHWQKEF